VKIRWVVVAVVVACGGPPSKYPARPDGCAVQLFKDKPTMATENIGHVSAHCEDIVKEADCLRTFEDEVCKLGGDVVWGTGDVPVHEENQWKYAGRAAHTK
jgi:hypothetical protein